jgi:hypothetical protein
MNPKVDVQINGDPVAMSPRGPLFCPRCGTAWRLKHRLCVNCLLSCGLDAETYDWQTLNDVLDQIDMSDAD